ncbi:hypothetical protein NI17_010180 [Thermobifida halotolerans]|uniref:Uncharacterized protein n=1 Tax=Thermobifida halotolerans TaxID=483545 RepID=A0AA97M0B3_9ACTN|nr:hypothetical protein [Thermobifida halotolerans]UOE21439.1 hypothetical protein NI17_010180 [Thermobifida halotolerans]
MANQAPVPPPRPVPGWLLPTVTGVVGVIVGAAGSALLSFASEAGAPDTFTAAVDECELNYKNSLARIGDEGASLVLDHQGADEAGGLSYAEVNCVLNALEAPDGIVAQMERTTALDGRQSASWDGITASWSYHPDRGLDIVFSLDQQH